MTDIDLSIFDTVATVPQVSQVPPSGSAKSNRGGGVAELYDMRNGNQFETTKTYRPKTLMEEYPIGAESTEHNNIFNAKKVAFKPSKFNPQDAIKFFDANDQWRSGNYNTGDHYDHTRLNTLDKYSNFYHSDQFVSYHVPLPLFVPSDQIYINSPRGLETQWRIFSSKTGVTRQKEQRALDEIGRAHV